MSKRVIAPVLLLLASLAAGAAVFAVQAIEADGGPLSEPYATRYFSPDGDGSKDVGEVRFRTDVRVRMTIEMLDGSGDVVRRLVDDRPLEGSQRIPIDGRGDDGEQLPDGTYEVRITIDGDDRRYAPPAPTVIDTRDPDTLVLPRGIRSGLVRGLVVVESSTKVTFELPDGTPLPDATLWRPAPDAHDMPSAAQLGDRIAYRYALAMPDGPVPSIVVTDRAGNEFRSTVVKVPEP